VQFSGRNVVAAANPPNAKLLFIFSNDFGELANALYFLLGQEFESRLLLPERLFAVNETRLPVPAASYRTPDDVMATVERHRPDLVFLFSGYLLAINNIFTIEEVESLVARLRDRCSRVVTSDPFLGILARLDDSTFSAEPLKKQFFREHFARVHESFRPITHLYLTDPRGFASTEAVSFSNENMVRPPAFVPCPRSVLAEVGADPSRPRWLFLLSDVDYSIQAACHGPRFDDLVTDKLREAARAGRQPVLVAPRACTSAVTLRSPPVDGLVLLTACRYELFVSLLLEAEYAFYWNIFSNSVVARVLNRLPIFFLDCGHMAQMMPALFAQGIKQYFGSSELPYHDLTRPLEAGRLATAAADQARALAPAEQNLRASPPPHTIVQSLLSRS
jgi:hypothetical protein